VRPPLHRTAALVTAAALALAACSTDGGDERARPADPATSVPSTSPEASAGTTAPPERAPEATTAEQRVEAALAGMSREEQIAQLFLVGVPLDGLDRAADLASSGVGGIFLAGRSDIPAEDLAAATGAWQEATPGPDLWVAVDQEGGNVQTLSGPGFTALPAAEEQGELPPAELAALADDLGAELARAGINLNLAPVADVVPAGTEESNEPIGYYGRHYGSTAEEVRAAVATVVDGMAEHGVTAVLKHFPGLGRVRSNTDTSGKVVDPVTLPDDAQVRAFAELADSPARPFVMTSSAVYPAIDATRPAGWSGQVVNQLLRRGLGFEGVVVSDDVGAAAAVQDVPPGTRAVRCLGAGGTLVLTVDPDLLAEMQAAVVARDRSDEYFSGRIDKAVRTALLAKAHAGLLTG
jgi:beta-glucosidase-like glycosyl hydrolase